MEESIVSAGDRVRTIHEDASFYETLQGYHNLPWTPRMATYIGKIGIVKEVVHSGIQVSFFSWGPAEITSSSDGRSSTETGRNRVVEATYTWYPRLIVAATEINLVDGDRAIMIRNKARLFWNEELPKTLIMEWLDMKTAAMVSVRVVDPSDGMLSLRMPHSTAFIWRQSDNPNDVILPVYTGRQLTSLMRDRNLPSTLATLKSSASRVVFGLPPHEPDAASFIETILHWSRTDDEKPFRLALRRNPELKNAAVNGRTALMVACDAGLWTAAAILLCLGAEKAVSDPAGNGLLHLAAQNCLVERDLLKKVSLPRIFFQGVRGEMLEMGKRQFGSLRYPLNLSSGHEQVVEGLLIFAADDVNRRNFKGETALHCAAHAASVACIDRLLNMPDINPNLQDVQGNTALHILAKMEEVPARIAMLHRMLSNVKVEQLIVNSDGLTPLQVAVVAGQAKVVESMIRMRPSLLVSEGCEAMLPLHLAAAYGWSDVLDTILKISGDISKTTKANRTALHFAVERWDGSADRDMQRLACIQSLVSHGVPLNIRDCNGSTALHLAVGASARQPALSPAKVDDVLRMSKPNIRLEEIASAIRPQWPLAVVCFLVAQGSDPQIRDRNGNTPVDLVVQPSFRTLFEHYAAFRSRACVPMSSSVERMFDSAGVTMCTFNCEDNVADTVLVPCGHRVVCTRCVGSTLIRRCPLCYQQISAAKNSHGDEVEVGGNLTKVKDSGDGDEEVEVVEDKKVIDEAEMWRIAQEAAERAKRAAEEEKEEVVRELRDKLEQLEMEVCCAICMDQRCTVAFQCGHTACADCSSPARLKLCHICRQSIKRRTTLYN
uniref:RING-type domain-containing protein n=1 Tax=Ascaris lumbricoides TaxID=6252 RepID=A0A9J2PRP9_ASCLU